MRFSLVSVLLVRSKGGRVPSTTNKTNGLPCSAYRETGGLVYFARMLDKIRLRAAGTLPAGYLEYLGKGSDGRCCRFLNVNYAAVERRVLADGTDEQVLDWCFVQGRRPSDEEIAVFNGFARKRGWRDDRDGGSRLLEEQKAANGLGHRSDIVTFFDFYDVDEGRQP